MSGPASAHMAQAALALYPLSPASRVELVRYGENTTYRVTDAGRSVALRLARPGYQTRSSIESEITWMDALRATGVDTPAVVPGRDGEIVQELDAGAAGLRLVVAFEWVEGIPLPEVEGPEPWRRLGALMAELHRHSREWSPPPGFTRPAWDLDALVGDAPRWGTAVPDGLWKPDQRRLILAARDAVRARLQAFGTGPDRFGMIHSDLGFENVLVGPDGRTVLIDFDDSGNGWYMYDLASVLYPLEGTGALEARRDMLTAGYREVCPLDDADVAELPTFLMARRLTTLGWTFSRADTPHAQRQRERRLASTPAAAREFLAWHAGRYQLT
jgi:Ser/Thr protein kinase RdoA (MazF antagonist)